MSALLPDIKSTRKRFTTVLGCIAGALAIFLWLTRKAWPGALAAAQKAGKEIKFWEPFQTIFWWTAVANLVLLVALILTQRWWLVAGKENEEPATPYARPGRIVWITLAVLFAGALALRVPRLSFSLYNDEAHNYVRYMSGSWKNIPVKGEAPKYRPTPWKETLVRNTAGNNSQLFSTLSRSSLELWKKYVGGSEGEVIETPVRIPSLLAGMGTLILLGALMWKWRGNSGLLWVVLLGATQAWLVRFQSEARSYSVMLLGVLVLFWFLNKAVQTGKWRHWLGFGFGVLLCPWAFLGSAYFMIALFMTLIVRQVVLWKRGEVDFQQVLRPLVAGGFAAMVGTQLMSSFIPPIINQMANFHSIKGVMGGSWWGDIISHLIYGSRWWEYDMGSPINFSMVRLLDNAPYMWISVIGGAAVFAAGWVCMVKRGGAALVMAISSPLSLLVAWFMMSRKGNYLLYWYIIYALPAFVVAIAYGLANIGDALKQKIANVNVANAVTVTIGLVLLLPQILCGIHWGQHGKQNERSPVEFVRGAVYPNYLGTEGEKPLMLCCWSNAPNYDPNCGIMASEADLNTMIERARKEQRPLYFHHSHLSFAKREHPAVFARLANPAEFEKVATFHGQEEEQFTHYLYKWVGK